LELHSSCVEALRSPHQDPLLWHLWKVPKIAKICLHFSDLHQIDNGWKGSTYPLCPGHEIVGEVVQAGDAVKKLKVGDRVGVGAQRDSCGTCHYCQTNQEQLCSGVSQLFVPDIYLIRMLEPTIPNTPMRPKLTVATQNLFELTKDLHSRFRIISHPKVNFFIPQN
jgi:hypothetical protein